MIHLQARLAVVALRELVAARTPTTLLRDDDFGERGIQLVVTRTGDPHVTLRPLTEVQAVAIGVGAGEGLAVELHLDLHVDVRKRVLGRLAQADGTLALRLATAVGVPRDAWRLVTRTEVDGLAWTEQPRLELAGLSLGGKRIADAVLRRARTRIAAQLDERVRTKFDLGSALEVAQAKVQQGFPLPPDGPTGTVVPNVRAVGWSVNAITDEFAEFEIGVDAEPVVELHPPSLRAAAALPRHPEAWQRISVDAAAGLQRASVVVTAASLSTVLAKALVGVGVERFGRSVRVEECTARLSGNEMLVALGVGGALSATLTLSGKPVLNADSGYLRLHDPELRVDAESAVVRVLAKALKPRVLREINAQLGPRTLAGLADAQREVNAKLAGVDPVPGIGVSGQLADLRIRAVGVEEGALHAELAYRLSLRANITRLPEPPA